MDALRRNNVQITGQGSQAMVFAHGFGCDQQMWRFVAPAFEPTHRVVCFDHIGCGKSDSNAYDESRHGTLNGYAQDVLEILEAAQLGDVIFVGHSVSAMIGVLAAIAEPQRFSRLVLVGPSPRYLNAPGYVGGFERADIDGLLDLMESNMLGWADFLAPAVMGPDSPADMTLALKQSFCAGDPYIARRFAMVTFLADNRADLALVRVPALVVQCADDFIAPLSVGEYVHRHLQGSELLVLPVAGHCPHMTHAGQMIAALRDYLVKA
jgi:sigma-B regulation protein RsbQ